MLRSSAEQSAGTALETPLAFDDGLVLRRVATLEEYQECVAIQEETWGDNFRERVPAAMLMIGQKLSGVCAAGFASDGRMLGFVFGITGPYRGELAHWSDLLAVRAEARGQHVGERLKRYQRQLCHGLGLDTIYWSFDPLVARNAHLNLRRLGARASEYVVNMYGNNTGSPLHGKLDTDRWVAAWDIAPASSTPLNAPARAEGAFVIRPSGDGLTPVDAPFTLANVVRIAIPVDYESLVLPHRVAWRHATRRAFLHYLGLGYQVTSFQRATREQPPFYELAASIPHL
jgi:predicted GNAT superfamily acetyltransferase